VRNYHTIEPVDLQEGGGKSDAEATRKREGTGKTEATKEKAQETEDERTSWRKEVSG
jgi:hypothetical protein